jgi:polyisoprenoid-binding protein YceI
VTQGDTRPTTAARPRPSGLGRRRRRRRARPDRPIGRTYPLKWVVVALAVTAVVLFGGPWIYFLIADGPTPGKLHLPAASDIPPGPLQPGPVTGTWVVSTGSVAGYRVHEILFGATHTAVGRTSQVSGGVVISGTEVEAADFTVDMASVKSDQGARDYQFRSFIMDTADYPHATFQLTSPIQLGTLPDVGAQITESATGNLTMRGVKRAVTFPLSAERTSATVIEINAEIPITFSEWHIPNPSFAVAQVGNTGTLEVLLFVDLTGANGKPVNPPPAPAPSTTTYTPGTL